MTRKAVIFLLSLAAVACLPLHCFSLPDANQVTFFRWSYGNREQFLIRAIDWSLEFSTKSYYNPTTTPMRFDVGFFSYRRNILLPVRQPQKWSRGLRIPLIVCLPVFAAYPTITLLFGPARLRRRRRKRGLCVKCGYDLKGNVSGVCPECGTEIEKP